MPKKTSAQTQTQTSVQNQAQTRAQKIDTIQKQLRTLLCFSIEEGLAYMRNIENFPDEGLDDFLNFLAEAKIQQDKFFTETIKKNPEFANKFTKFLSQTSANLKGQFEAKEQGEAEKTLDESITTTQT